MFPSHLTVQKELPRDVAVKESKKISIRNLLQNKLFPNCLLHVDIQQEEEKKIGIM